MVSSPAPCITCVLCRNLICDNKLGKTQEGKVTANLKTFFVHESDPLLTISYLLQVFPNFVFSREKNTFCKESFSESALSNSFSFILKALAEKG